MDRLAFHATTTVHDWIAERPKWRRCAPVGTLGDPGAARRETMISGSTPAPDTRRRRRRTAARAGGACRRAARDASGRPSGTGRSLPRAPAPAPRRGSATRRRREPWREIGYAHGLVVIAVDLDHPAADVRREQDAGEPSARDDAQRVGERCPDPNAGPACPSTCWSSRPPANTFIAWKPRQIPSTGTPRASAACHAARSSASRAGSTAPRPGNRPVAHRVQVRTAGQQQPVHRRERRCPIRIRGTSVERDRDGPVASDGVDRQRLLARGELGITALDATCPTTTMRGAEPRATAIDRGYVEPGRESSRRRRRGGDASGSSGSGSSGGGVYSWPLSPSSSGGSYFCPGMNFSVQRPEPVRRIVPGLRVERRNGARGSSTRSTWRRS